VFFHVLLVDGSWRAAWARRGKFFLLLALTWIPLVFLVWQNRTRDGAAGFGLGITSWEYVLTQCRAIIHYLALSFWPHPLVMDYGRTVAHDVREVWPQVLLLAGLLVVTLIAVLRKIPAAFAGVWFFAILAPSSSVVPLITQTIAEHRMYLPLAGVIVLTVTGAHALAGRRSFIALAAIAVVLMVASLRRNEVYRTALSAWGDVVAKLPDNPRALNNLGNLLDDAGRPEEARRHYQHALDIQPHNALAHYNLANTLAHRSQLGEAIAHYQASLRLDPTSADTHLNLGNAFALEARWAEAEAEFAAALRLNADDPLAHNNRGNALLQLGRSAEAVQEYATALRGMANDPTVHFNLGTALAADGQMA
jgi:tetratricopeptide (TPR) repeat protein